jgi:hypothetical protein
MESGDELAIIEPKTQRTPTTTVTSHRKVIYIQRIVRKIDSAKKKLALKEVHLMCLAQNF